MIKEESGYILVTTLMLIIFVTAFIYHSGQIIKTELLITLNQEVKVAEKYILSGVKRVVERDLKEFLKVELKRKDLTKANLDLLKDKYNQQSNEIKLAEEEFSYQLLSLADNYARLNLNYASAKALEELTGVGPILAERILKNREYKYIIEVESLTGIGPKRVKAVKDLVTTVGDGRININTANQEARAYLNYKLGLTKALDNKYYANLTDLLVEIEPKEEEVFKKAAKLLLRFDSQLFWVKYRVENKSQGLTRDYLKLIDLTKGQAND